MKNLESLTIKSERVNIINKKAAVVTTNKWLSLIYRIDRGYAAPLPMWEKIKDLIDPGWPSNKDLLGVINNNRIKYPIVELNKVLTILSILYTMLHSKEGATSWVRDALEMYVIPSDRQYDIRITPSGKPEGGFKNAHYPIAFVALDELANRRSHGENGIFGVSSKEMEILLWLKDNHINSLATDYWYEKAVECAEYFSK